MSFSNSKKQIKPARAIQRDDDGDWLGDDGEDCKMLFDQAPGRHSLESTDTVCLTSDTEDESITLPATVFEPTVALRPACVKYHVCFKGKGREDERRYLRPKFRTCGRYNVCERAILHPPSARQSIYRLQTSDPAHDLKRWLLTRNERIGGGWETRGTSASLLDTRFTTAHFREALSLAVTEIHYEHVHMKHLARYARRSAYRLNIFPPLAPEAEPRWLDLKPDDGEETFVGFSRNALVVELVQAADELDYLRGLSEDIAAKVLERKMELAEEGDSGEQGDLVRAGFVSEEWVTENC